MIFLTTSYPELQIPNDSCKYELDLTKQEEIDDASPILTEDKINKLADSISETLVDITKAQLQKAQ